MEGHEVETDADAVRITFLHLMTVHYTSYLLCFTSIRVLLVIRNWLQDHHLLNCEPAVIERVQEFLSYIKTPERHERAASRMYGMIQRVSSHTWFHTTLSDN